MDLHITHNRICYIVHSWKLSHLEIGNLSTQIYRLGKSFCRWVQFTYRTVGHINHNFTISLTEAIFIAEWSLGKEMFVETL